MRLPALFTALVLCAASALAGTPRTVVLDVQNMTCSLCPVTVKKSLTNVTGVAQATVDLNRKTATVEFDPDVVEVSDLVRATTQAGFPSIIRK